MVTLEDVFKFSHDPEFTSYQDWFALSEREKNDPSIKLTSEELSHLESWENIQNIYEKVLPEAVSVLASYEESFRSEFQKYEKSIKDLENQNKLLEFYKSVLDRLTKLYLDSLSDMLSEVYRTVYDNPMKSILLSMEDFRNKKVIKIKVINKINGQDFVEDFGLEGGAAHIMLGLIVSVYFILTTGLPRIIFVDEGLSQLFPETHIRFMGILKQFVDQLGFTFVIVDHHAERFSDFADNVYTVSDGIYSNVNKEEFFRQFQ